jgi:L-lactate utilization protein LutB
MDNSINQYWQIRLAEVKNNLERNNFEVFIVENTKAAKKLVLNDLILPNKIKRISWGGSKTFTDTGIYQALKDNDNFEILDSFDKSISREEMLERRRQSLLVDLYITGTNAVTETGQLINLDMIGNRVAALTFGPKKVIVLVGRNKIVTGLNEAMDRIKNYAAPVNSIRLNKRTPCTKTSFCEECIGPNRICNTWTITEKSFPAKRVTVVLINEDLGL